MSFQKRNMKAILAILFLALSSSYVGAQRPCTPRDIPYEIQISREFAASLLIHKVDPVCKPVPMGARVTGTAVIDIVIGKQGEVKSAKAISGPRMLVAPALAAVRQYRYKSYVLCGTAVEPETTVAIQFTCP